MTIDSDLSYLKERQIDIKGILKGKLKARHLQWIVEQIDNDDESNPIAEELFQIIIQERNERAKINSSQGLEISRKEGKIIQLDRKNENLQTENLTLQEEVSHWKEKADQLLQQLDELRKNLLDFDKSELYQLGLWLKNSLSKKGEERKQSLLEQGLVHKENYNEAVSDLRFVIDEQQDKIKQQTKDAVEIITTLQSRIDTLRNNKPDYSDDQQREES